MASIRCAHCTATHTSVAEVRACAVNANPKIATAIVARQRQEERQGTVKTVTVGNVLALTDAPGRYWEVINTTSFSQGQNIYVELISTTPEAQQGRWISPGLIVQVWDTWSAAADSLIAATLQAAPDDKPLPIDKITNGAWAHVNDLRAQAKEHLVREERGKKVGYFALLTQEGPHDVVKFYRVRTGNAKGKWRHHLFVDAQASDDFYPVKQKDSLTAVLEGILADPEAAGLLYATELGRCCRCRRTLTDETSRARGMGPECFEK